MLYAQSIMETRKTATENAPTLYPEFNISKLLDHFRAPPCQPPCGREILERFFHVLFAQPKHRRDLKAAAHTVATELANLWTAGDARIPQKAISTLAKQIFDFRADLKTLGDKSKAGRESYQKKVNR